MASLLSVIGYKKMAQPQNEVKPLISTCMIFLIIKHKGIGMVFIKTGAFWSGFQRKYYLLTTREPLILLDFLKSSVSPLRPYRVFI